MGFKSCMLKRLLRFLLPLANMSGLTRMPKTCVLPQAARCEILHAGGYDSQYKNGKAAVASLQFTITMPSNSERSNSGPAHGNSRENATALSRLPSVSLEDEKDEEIARWKRAYHDALAEKTNEKDTEKKNP